MHRLRPAFASSVPHDLALGTDASRSCVSGTGWRSGCFGCGRCTPNKPWAFGRGARRSARATHVTLVLTERPLSEDELLIARSWLYERWADIIERDLGEPHIPTLEHGTDLRTARKAEYLAKLGLELSDPGLKKGKDGHRSPMQILFDWCEGDSDWDLALYRHYAEAMKGRQFLTWSKKGVVYELKKQMQDAIEKGKKAEPAAMPIAAIADRDWDELRHKADDIAVTLLETAERRGLPGVLELMRQHLGKDAVRHTVGMTGWQRDAMRAQAPPVKVEPEVHVPALAPSPEQMVMAEMTERRRARLP